MLDWYTIVCCYFYSTFFFSFVRGPVSIVLLLTLLCCAFSVISTIVLYVPYVEIKKVVLSRRPAGRPRPSVPHKASPVSSCFFLYIPVSSCFFLFFPIFFLQFFFLFFPISLYFLLFLSVSYCCLLLLTVSYTAL